MKIRTLGWTEIPLTTIGLGCWAMGGANWAYSWGSQDDTDSIRTICEALDRGINWIDTAPVYGLGHSEEVVGRALRESGTRPFIATKCGLPWSAKRRVSPRLKRESVRQELEQSLRRLGIECIDLYQIHWPNPDEDIEEAWEEISLSVKAGKVRFAGVSNFSAEQIKRVMPIHPVASLQPPYSLFKRDIETELLPFCRQHNIGVIAYSPLQKGLLTGAMTRERIANLPVDDHRRYDPLFKTPQLEINLAFVESLRSIASHYNRPVSHLALAWNLRRPEVTANIVGARHPRQIDETAGGSDWDIPAEAVDEINAALIRCGLQIGE